VEFSSTVKAKTLPSHRPTDYALDLEPGYKIPYGRFYNLSEFELQTLKANIKINLASGIIQQSSSPAAAHILFPKKTDGRLQLCGDYRALNPGPVKNPSPPLSTSRST